MKLLPLLLTLILPLTALGVCTQGPNYVECDLESQTVQVPANYYLTLVNRSSWQTQQVHTLQAQFYNETKFWSEFCLYLDDFIIAQPGVPGIGECGCTFKNVGETYRVINWGYGGLSVPPGSRVYIGSHTVPSPKAHTYSIVVAPQSVAFTIRAYRFPQADQVIQGNGQTQWTNWNPRKNTSTRPWYVSGAIIYAAGGGAGVNTREYVTAAVMYILRADGSIRWSSVGSTTFNVTNSGFNFPTQVVAPGESLSVQAINRTTSIWDYVAYVFVWY